MQILKPLSVHKDSRRTLTNLFRADIKEVNLLEVRMGQTIGNHLHKETDEYFYVVKGVVLVNHETTICRGATFFVPKNEHHTIEALADSMLMSLQTKAFDENNKDIHAGSDNRV